MILTGKIVPGEGAKMCGLVSELVQPKELLAKTEEVAEKIISKGPLAVRLAKLSINAGLETDIKTGLVIEKLAQALLMSTEDKKEGTQAFLEKRKPKFQGK
jgi:enoyl-CoA hydratase